MLMHLCVDCMNCGEISWLLSSCEVNKLACDSIGLNFYMSIWCKIVVCIGEIRNYNFILLWGSYDVSNKLNIIGNREVL